MMREPIPQSCRCLAKSLISGLFHIFDRPLQIAHPWLQIDSRTWGKK